ncbi:bifunctional alpha,alpha-trehalose-phosphate synthase (UDP-forming)/trehalose-phosphatase [Mucilaginibacter sp.]|jgi:trehalose 6-phosphate synthase/phosphatase|uniref:bifunctional alpha,alpha-trehalose-phosphate synthase (UDP-forming)/trehalose-phosphatase n=1 Tax=Mucilaginibacter sp. TaxID=1882438 RepID=UPI002D1AEC17|nr:bifunctional alpha,alpha-trehalose-phosphate synthase (UDP-forming)/trehalose-phosphatase [Mucilaginibacter sp.]HTI61262.1 bifunctional alpha,alpha-trehalose-phosphate synthase (UDP-forming)/trehalose-phosphatase [Mucilaginibacter sp.]
MMKKRLFIISNRLPLTIETIDNNVTMRQSSGGLISAITTYLKGSGKEYFSEKIWAGVPGCTEKTWDIANNEHSPADYNYLPVFMKSKMYELYYNGFSNSLLWPLFHYFPSFAEYHSSYFDAYMEANRSFADILSKQVRNEDFVWIHDYHLLPLAGMLRAKFPKLTIGFFLHIPFPSYEIFRVIPKQWQREILTGMLGADLIGFHTVDYSSHFLSCVEMALKTGHDGQHISWENRQIKVDAFPISIDFYLFNNAFDNVKVEAIRKTYLKLKKDKKLLFSVDRLDYTKGLYNRLKGFKKFLLANPEYHGKVVFALVVVPSRDSIRKYAERKKIIDEFIGNLNSTLGTINWQPIIYQYNHLDFEQLIALYTTCDVALITPLRDGMNLVSKEFVASRKDKQGVLILSEMAGAARELTEALLINPNDTDEIAEMIKQGFEMKKNEQEERMTAMQERISRYDVNAWAGDYLNQLKEVKDVQLGFEIKFLDNFSKARLLENYSSAQKRLILLDYDGTLVPFSKDPLSATPGNKVLELLDLLSREEQNTMYIVSGRDSVTLEKWLGHLPVGLIAEHGAKIRHPNGSWENETAGNEGDWMGRIEKQMDKFVSKCPHSFIEKKDFSIAWHYRNADLTEGMIRAKELYEELFNGTTHLPLNVLNGNKVIEVRNKGVNKGAAIEKLTMSSYDFVLCIGDDKTDEDMFVKLARMTEAYTIKVGNEASFAKYNLHSPYLVHSLLESMSIIPKKESWVYGEIKPAL